MVLYYRVGTEPHLASPGSGSLTLGSAGYVLIVLVQYYSIEHFNFSLVHGDCPILNTLISEKKSKYAENQTEKSAKLSGKKSTN